MAGTGAATSKLIDICCTAIAMELELPASASICFGNGSEYQFARILWPIGNISFLDDRDECDDVVATKSICPAPDCGALAV